MSQVLLDEDPISTFFTLDLCPTVINSPKGVIKETGEILRKEENFSIEMVYDVYDCSEVPLKSQLDDIFYVYGRIRPHERILCWFPKYLEHFIETRRCLDDGVLRSDHMLYLGIMAVSCYKCDYLLNILEE